MEEKGGRFLRNNYKGYMDQTKEGWNQGSWVGMAGVGWGEWLGVNADNCTLTTIK